MFLGLKIWIDYWKFLNFFLIWWRYIRWKFKMSWIKKLIKKALLILNFSVLIDYLNWSSKTYVTCEWSLQNEHKLTKFIFKLQKLTFFLLDNYFFSISLQFLFHICLIIYKKLSSSQVYIIHYLQYENC